MINSFFINLFLRPYRIEEVHHLLQVFLGIHTHTMSTFGNKGGFGLHACSLQQLIELLSLTARYDIVFFTMEDDDRRIVLVNIVGSTQTAVLIRFLSQF
jgi:hypothetical protein